MIVSVNEFTNAFRSPMSPFVASKIEGYGLEHDFLQNAELEEALVEIIEGTQRLDLAQSGPARHPIWEDGWAQNLDAFDPTKAGPALARPRYFNKHPIVRWNRHLCRAKSPDYEYNMLAVIQHWVFERWFKEHPAVYEFGCGTGHNLFRVRELNPTAKLVGLDWAESAVKFINLQAKHGADPGNNMEARLFNLFRPDPTLDLKPQDAVYTVAALEQVGEDFGPFLDFILAKRPALVAHIEPFGEFLDPKRLIDYLSLEYFKKRKYLKGYLTKLRQLAKEGLINIHEECRTHVGSKFIEGYGVVVWSPRS